MRVFIISDMEGVAGITKWNQTDGGHQLYLEARELYTEEINAAARGAFAAGATEVVAMDCHGAGGDYSFNSLLPDKLDERMEFVVQREWSEYTGILEDGCDGALFVGMHAMAGALRGVMNHTVSSENWHSLSFNDQLVGEVGINAALCGAFGCPVLLVTGDDVVCDESRELLGDGLTTVAVKQGLGRYSARHKTPAAARTLIEDAARECLKHPQAVAPYDPGPPCEIKVELFSSDHAEQFGHRPDVEVVDGRTVISRGDDWLTAWRQFYLSYSW
jgi:D-amino peptidase